MLNEKKVVPKLRQEVKVKVDIVTSDDIKIYYTRKFQDFTARYIIHVVKGWKESFGTLRSPALHITIDQYLTRLGEFIIFEPWRENYHFSQPS